MSSLGNKDIMAKNLKHYMETNNITRSELCTALNIKYSTMSEWINGKAYPRIDKIELMANYFGINKSDLIEDKTATDDIIEKIGGFPYNPVMHRIPILGHISAGLPLYAEQHIEGYTYTDLNSGGEYFALRVKGDSMNAVRIFENDILIIRRQPTVENGEIAVVRVGDENATVKRFYNNSGTVTLMPQSNNPEHLPQIYNLKDTKIEVLGKVVRNQIEFD